MAITTDVDIANSALVLIGASKITAFSDSGDEALAAEQMYDFALESLLGRYRWRFASAMVQLSRVVAAPVHRWDAAYTLPSNLIVLHGIFVNDLPIDYDRYELTIQCNATTDDEVYADYSAQPTVAKFSSYFKEALTFRMAANLATSLAGDAPMAVKFGEDAQRAFILAKNQDAQSQTTRKIPVSRFASIRGSVQR